MSYDLMAFDPAGPPADRAGFLAWYSAIARMGDGKLTRDPSITQPNLRAWHQDMIKHFPSSIGLDGSQQLGDMDGDNRAEYRFTDQAVFASFQWEASRHAHRQATKLARLHNVGLFEVSGDTAAVWGPTPKGFYTLIHRNY
jgi:hypothetical protein